MGITGSIAAYKAATLTRLLVKSGAEVQIVCTADAIQFITPLTLSTLSKRPVLSGFQKNETGEWNNHVELGLWADIILIAPASANTIAKCVNGICDNLLLATYLSAKCPVAFAPAMDLDMYQHPSTTNNLKALAEYGNIIFDSTSGELASGLAGKGRMQEPEDLHAALVSHFASSKLFKNKRVLITAGPTHESIDPVRFIGNHSSGKMGYAIAKAFKMAGAAVTLITGPTAITIPEGLAQVIKVTTAEEMFAAADRRFAESDITVLTAAVADYRPTQVATEKIKKTGDEMSLRLVKTIDIAKTLGARKRPDQFVVGFALETENEESNAQQKLKNKNLDLIVLNSLRNEQAAFGYDTNQVKIFDSNGLRVSTELMQKADIAELLLKHIKND